MQILEEILQDVREGIAQSKSTCPEGDLLREIADQAPSLSLSNELVRHGFGLIAEIKNCSPSMGPMRPQNVRAAPKAYDESPVVRAFSILTNKTYFGSGLEDLRRLRTQTRKPILRKDFIIDPYQILEARAAGADAILLMANILSAEQMNEFHGLAGELGMDALCEIHTEEELTALPPRASLVGINARKFKGEDSAETFARSREKKEGGEDFTIHFDAFSLFPKIPSHTLKVAESGMNPQNISRVLQTHPFAAALVGTSLLQSSQGVEAELAAFARALEKR